MTAATLPAGPRVSVIMAARNVGPYIDEALQSLRGQSLHDLEVLVVDDGSTDDTRARARSAASSDPRIRLFDGPGRGPAAARNLALREARGEWIAVVDGDDVVAPERLERLVAEGEARAADLVADNLTAFYSDGRPEHPWLQSALWSLARSIDVGDYLGSSGSASADGQLGYLKPLFRARLLRDHALAYDEALFIGEDYDLVMRCLLQGAAFHYVPFQGYRYRRHAGSISHRIEAGQLTRIADGLKRLKAASPDAFHTGFDARIAEIEADLAFVRSVEAIKRGSPRALAEAVWLPQSRRRLLQAAREGIQRRVRLMRAKADRTALKAEQTGY